MASVSHIGVLAAVGALEALDGQGDRADATEELQGLVGRLLVEEGGDRARTRVAQAPQLRQDGGTKRQRASITALETTHALVELDSSRRPRCSDREASSVGRDPS